MPFIIRSNPLPNTGDAPMYWLPGAKGYTRTADIKQAVARGFLTKADASAYMASYGAPEGKQNEVIEAQ